MAWNALDQSHLSAPAAPAHRHATHTGRPAGRTGRTGRGDSPGRAAGRGGAARTSDGTVRPLPPDLDPRVTHRRRSTLRRLSVTLVALVSLAVLAVTSVGWAAYRHFDNAIDRNDWEPTAGARPAEVPGDLNLLLLGNDSREGTHGEFGDPGGMRADTTIIAHFDADGSATLVSFPRDTLVPIVPRSAAIARDGLSKIADVVPLVGVPGLISTLEGFTGLKIDHTVSINLAGFRAMTDAVGGVTVCVRSLPDGSTRNLRDAESGWRGQLGENRLDGGQALAFVRTRKALGEERLRILRQQQFLSRLLDAATSTGVLTSPARISSLLGAVGGALEISRSLSQAEMLRLARRVAELGPGGLRFVTIPTYVPLPVDGAVDGMGTIPPHGMVLLHDPAGLEALLGPMRAAGTGGSSTTGTPPDRVMLARPLPGGATPATAPPAAGTTGTGPGGTTSTTGSTGTSGTAGTTDTAGTGPGVAVPPPAADTSCTP